MLKTKNISQTKDISKTVNISSYLNERWKQAGERLAALRSAGKLTLQYNGEKLLYLTSLLRVRGTAGNSPCLSLTCKNPNL